MTKTILAALLVLCFARIANADAFDFASGVGQAKFGDSPETLAALKLTKTGEDKGAAVYASAAPGGDLDGLPILSRQYAFADGKLIKVILYFNAWHVDDAMALAKKRLGEPAEENALMAAFSSGRVTVTVNKKQGFITVAASLPAPETAPAVQIAQVAQSGGAPVADQAGGAQTPPTTAAPASGEAPPASAASPSGTATVGDSAQTLGPGVAFPQPQVQETKPAPSKHKDPELFSQTKLLAYSLNMILDKMDKLEQDSADNRISFASYSEAYGKLAKESESLTSRYPKADIKLQELAVVLNNLVSDLTFLTQKILSVKNDASLSGSLLNSAVSGATGNYLGVINSITGYFGTTKSEEKIKADIVSMRKRFAETREEYARKLMDTRAHVKERYDIEF